jgi:hypothetical protein
VHKHQLAGELVQQLDTRDRLADGAVVLGVFDRRLQIQQQLYMLASQAFAWAAARRKGSAWICSEALAMVAPWLGARAVSPSTM